jgi:hypothetical protein
MLSWSWSSRHWPSQPLSSTSFGELNTSVSPGTSEVLTPRAALRASSKTLAAPLLSVSHLLHMTFLPELYGSLCHPCFVNPAMSSPPRLRSQWEVFLQDVGLVLGRYVRPRGHGHTVQLSFSPRIQ